MTMARGKQTCKILKEIRRQIADANDIEFVTSECRHKGDCLGTCPKCEAEVRYLEQQLRTRSIAGKAVTLAGISAASLAMLMPMTSEAKTVEEPQNLLKGSISIVTDTVTVRGIALSGDTLHDGTISKEPLIGATILNKRTKSGTYADLDGHFELPACIGDTLEVKYVGYESLAVVVTENMRNVEITLAPSQAILGEYVVVVDAINEEKHYLDLNVVDEKGNPIIGKTFTFGVCGLMRMVRKILNLYILNVLMTNILVAFIGTMTMDLRGEDGKPLKEATLRIEAEGYDGPVTIKVKYPKRNAKKTIKFRNKKK